MTDTIAEPAQLTRKDFVSDQEVRWCPGCGDYAILAQMQKVLAEVGVPREQTVFVSGIGCSSRFPYYMDTYGIHSIHGRAPTVATGIKSVNPDLSVWVITGDGDGLSIGGNHLVHCMRRNVDVKVILFNNRVYGLTKGQYSPTSLQGHRTKSTPMGSIDYPFNPISVAIGAEATFVARTQDTNTKHLQEVLRRAAAHRGTAFVEIFQNCVVYNPTAWDHTTDSSVRDDNIVYVEEGQPLVFGRDSDKGVRVNGMIPEVVKLSDVDEGELATHQEGLDNSSYAYMLSRMQHPEFPLPFGVLRSVDRPAYTDLLVDQVQQAMSDGDADLDALLRSSDTWVVE
ncbi:MAG: 2-oxoacid:ferredoxin oxidoreductase subunit beta [Gemmatimonadetes bacterium]|jgi:2-oxoglutarate/2-oxoacid ferredoxin oxidoreductase subunit beta|nr:2-oxoacid:ferredoxin oxidoreductase subunit beta [Gemmatimonadota bacterium]MBT7862208.1 2-oxoacid:ferredoxin oxidoreductase subunit beta [Gemmatimonadota bacterium]